MCSHEFSVALVLYHVACVLHVCDVRDVDDVNEKIIFVCLTVYAHDVI
jgi:hypothetical protein